jgi:hypothetical protein
MMPKYKPKPTGSGELSQHLYTITVAITELHASRPRKDFTHTHTHTHYMALSHQYSISSFAMLEVLSCLHLPVLCCLCCNVVWFCCDLEACNLVTTTTDQWSNLITLSSMQAHTLTFNMFPYERVIHDVTTVLLQNSLKLIDVIVLVGGDKVCHSQYLGIILVRFCFLWVKRVDARLHEPKTKKFSQAILKTSFSSCEKILFKHSLLWKQSLSMGPLPSQFSASYK